MNNTNIPIISWTSAQAFPTKSGPALLKVTNPDGSTTGLIFDVHKYLDSDNSGTHTECVTDNISTAFSPLATWLRTNKRQAMNTETGGGNTASCQKYLCQQLQFIKYVILRALNCSTPSDALLCKDSLTTLIVKMQMSSSVMSVGRPVRLIPPSMSSARSQPNRAMAGRIAR